MSKLPEGGSETVLAGTTSRPTRRRRRLAEANRCLYCADAPCIKACPTAIDIPEFIRKIATGNVKGSAQDHLRGEHPRHELRAGLPGRGALRRRLRLQRAGRAADPDRQAPALRDRRRPSRRAGASSRPARPPARASALVGGGPGVARLRARAAPLRPRVHDLREARRARRAQHHRRRALQDARGSTRSTRSTGSSASAASRSRPASRSARTSTWAELEAQPRRGVHRRRPRRRHAASASPARSWRGIHGAVDFIERMKLGQVDARRRAQRASVVGGGNTAIDAVRELRRARRAAR